MSWIYEQEKECYRARAINAAKDLCYGELVINLIKEAKTNNEIEHIMVNARKGMYKKKGKKNN